MIALVVQKVAKAATAAVRIKNKDRVGPCFLWIFWSE